MKTIVFLGFMALAWAAPQSTDPIPIVKQETNINPDGSYSYSYETGNGITAEERGELKNVGGEEPVIVVQGEYQYPSDDGTFIKMSYIADENGFRPIGDHLPAGLRKAYEYQTTGTAPTQTGSS